MRTARDILPKLTNVPPVTPNVVPLKPDTGTVSVINSLFRELQSIFPAWKQAWPDQDALGAAKATWTKAFMSERINRIEQIRFGIEQCRKLATPFAPSVGEFIVMCQPTAEQLGLPSVTKAFHEACRNVHPSMAGVANWSHDAVYHAACESGFRNLNTLPQDASRRLFERNYQIAVRAILAGEPLRKMPLALPAKAESRSTPAVGRAALAELRARRSGGAQ
jgi:hypothetical protein